MKTLIAVPCMDMLHTQFASCLLGLKPEGEYEVTFGVSSLIYDTRNQLIVKAIEGGFDRMLWLDSDMAFEPSILQLLNEDLDNGYGIVSGLYFSRRAPLKPTVFKVCEIHRLEGDKLDPVSESYLDYPRDSLFEIAACGFGCVMMDMAAVKQITDRYGRMLFMPVAGFGEDLSFCMRSRNAGVRIWCDSRVKLGHIGQRVFDEELYLKVRENGTD